MKNQRITLPDDDHRVLQFRLRDAARLPTTEDGGAPTATILPFRRDLPQVDHLPETDGADQAPSDFRHRMLTNIAALVLTAGLVLAGIWLATSIAEMRRTQDCLLMGRHDCAVITAPR
ncbi:MULTISPECIES: hypothetical protein [Rhodopseudomonas]|uniref:hypothetical protein n=1 Tax=Rhodopseudomonas TaxID=1073 RepID=UPI0006424E4D|nr:MULTISPECIES: hypothetical protein [Rhodopseudomonas]NEW85796.1 hypothetical protein [Rhodopseudomonas sp. WA056]